MGYLAASSAKKLLALRNGSTLVLLWFLALNKKWVGKKVEFDRGAAKSKIFNHMSIKMSCFMHSLLVYGESAVVSVILDL